MKKFTFLLLLTLITAFTATAQTRTRYTFDNFDTATGVQVVVPQTTIVPQKKAPLVKKTSSQTMRLQEGVSLKGNPYVGRAVGSSVSMGSNSSLKGFTTGSMEIDSYIVDSSQRYGIDPLLIYAQMHQESTFKLKATSNKGASGLMQLMPATARRFGVTDIYDPRQNIDAGVRYMRWLLDTFNGDVTLALAGYNAGEGAVMKYGYQIPPYNETREYVRRIMNRYSEIGDPNAIRTVKKVSNTQVAKLDKKGSAPLTVYEVTPLIVRTADGRMRLVNQ